MKPARLRSAVACIAGALALLSAPSFASALELEQIGDEGSYQEPVSVTSDPGDRDRLFVAQWDGTIRLTEDGETSTFLDLTSHVLRNPSGGTKEGLTSIAFPHDFATSRRLYAAYVGSQDTATADPGDLHVDQFTVSAAGDGVVPGSRLEVLIVPVGNEGHYGGHLQFGPDGYLYISTGDGGPQEDPFGRAQDLSDLRGKLLRIQPSAGGGYSIPPDNPFAGPDGARDEIWSLGLRNPWRFSFDRLTGDLTLTDVGNMAREEIDFEPRASGAGRATNFGWNCREGTMVTGFGPGPCDGTYRDPVLEYPHEFNPCDAIVGGYVVRDPGLEELQGRYVYADHCTGEMRSAILARPAASDDRHELAVGSFGPSSFGEDACGRVYVADLSGPVYRIQDSTPATASECGPPPPPPAPADTRAPLIELDSKDTQRLRRTGRIKLRLTSDEDGTLEVDGKVGPTASLRARTRSFPLHRRSIPLDAGAEARASWTFGERRTKRLRYRLRRGRRVMALFTYAASDAAGNRVDGEAKVRLTYR